MSTDTPRPADLDAARILRAIVAPATPEADRWLLRIALLEACGIEPTPEHVAHIGGADVERAWGAVGGALVAEGLVEVESREEDE